MHKLMISYGFYVEFPQEPIKPHTTQLWSCDVGLLIIEECYEINLVVFELLNHVIVHV